MGAGLICGMGYLGFAGVFTLVLCLAFIIYTRLDLGTKRNGAMYKSFRITIPEDLDYSGVFDEVFEQYTRTYELVNVKTVGMGSLFRLTYDVVLKDPSQEKELIDHLRCRNGNLEIMVSKQSVTSAEL